MKKDEWLIQLISEFEEKLKRKLTTDETNLLSTIVKGHKAKT
ncbi:hypothetical protein ABC345_21145 [Shouchella sp. 1P09AA]